MPYEWGFEFNPIVATKDLGATVVIGGLVCFQHNAELQTQTQSPIRKTICQRMASWALGRVELFCKLVFLRAGRLSRPKGS